MISRSTRSPAPEPWVIAIAARATQASLTARTNGRCRNSEANQPATIEQMPRTPTIHGKPGGSSCYQLPKTCIPAVDMSPNPAIWPSAATTMILSRASSATASDTLVGTRGPACRTRSQRDAMLTSISASTRRWRAPLIALSMPPVQAPPVEGSARDQADAAREAHEGRPGREAEDLAADRQRRDHRCHPRHEQAKPDRENRAEEPLHPRAGSGLLAVGAHGSPVCELADRDVPMVDQPLDRVKMPLDPHTADRGPLASATGSGAPARSSRAAGRRSRTRPGRQRDARHTGRR